ncbi:hypothetical protein TNCV_2904621 [Trichonephila clavipes]|nr:hypothetical protein TNCV_2904621 [Trichonephila clavipes]
MGPGLGSAEGCPVQANLKVSFTGFAVRHCALSCNKITLPCLLAHSGCLSITAWSRRASRVHNTQYRSGSTRHKACSFCRSDLALVLKSRLRQMKAIVFSTSVVKINPFFVTIRYKNDFLSWH